MIRVWLVVSLSLFLTGCSPDYNWREVALDEVAVKAFFPDKPKTQERTVNFLGHELRFALSSATVDEAAFTVGYALLPDSLRGDSQAKDHLAATVIGSLYQNLGADAPSPLPALGERFTVQGSSPEGPIRLQAQVWLTDEALVEGIVSAPDSGFPQSQAEEFFQGLKVHR